MNVIDEFFKKKLITETNTIRSYRSNINKYFKLINKDIDTYFNDKPLDEYENDLNKAYLELENNGVSKLTRKTMFNSVKQLMITMDKRTKQLDIWDTIKTRLKHADTVTEKFIPNLDDLKQLIAHTDTCSRAFILMLASSGRRIGELLGLQSEDINTNTKPTTITIKRIYDRKKGTKPYTKTGKKNQICFISDEATDSYHAWMKERDSYLKTACKKSKYDKNENDPRVFPMTDENMRKMWSTVIEKSRLGKKDSATNWLTLHPHCLRYFFRSYFGNSDLAEYLLGHKGGMYSYYQNMKKEDLANEYLKYMKNVTVSSTMDTKRINGLESQIKEKDKQIQQLSETLKIMELRMQGLENKLEIEKIKNEKNKIKN